LQSAILKIVDKKSSLVSGKDTDNVIFDGIINVEMTIIKGEIVHGKTIGS
jgi:N-acetylglucosamine-6-phosphate deacetylase